MIKSAIPIYAAAFTFLMWGLISPIYRLSSILLACASSIAVYLIAGRVFPGRKVEEEVHTLTGDEEIDKQISEGRETIARFREAALVMGDERVKASLGRISNAGEAIINEAVRDAGDRQSVYTFFSYYLPTVEKLLSHYCTFAGGGDNVKEGRARIEDSLDMVAEAFEKQLDKLYRNEAMDVKTDIAVMEAMLRSEGLKADRQEDNKQVQTAGKGGNNV
ncbi:MAG: 5-bromo-4-chloroindolyl phosphate hydrolysis family protein [Clostridia bacterium]|nr:5-bromo-4-chloroindolyl phosphate hydrolysis family protein [Clostridia bacterium]